MNGPITAEEMANELNRLGADLSYNAGMLLASGILAFIQSRAAGVQGVDELLRSENPDRKDFTVDEALRIADQNDAAYKHVPSVSRTLASEVRRLATPQPPKDAGAVALPEMEVLDALRDYVVKGYTEAQMIAYGDAREAAAIKAMFCSAVPGACPHEVCACAGVKFPDPDDAGRADAVPDSVTRTDHEIVQQTEELAALFMLEIYSREAVGGDSVFRDADDLRGKHCWQLACRVQEMLTATDPENAVSGIDDSRAAHPSPAHDGAGDAEALAQWMFDEGNRLAVEVGIRASTDTLEADPDMKRWLVKLAESITRRLAGDDHA